MNNIAKEIRHFILSVSDLCRAAELRLGAAELEGLDGPEIDSLRSYATGLGMRLDTTSDGIRCEPRYR